MSLISEFSEKKPKSFSPCSSTLVEVADFGNLAPYVLHNFKYFRYWRRTWLTVEPERSDCFSGSSSLERRIPGASFVLSSLRAESHLKMKNIAISKTMAPIIAKNILAAELCPTASLMDSARGLFDGEPERWLGM